MMLCIAAVTHVFPDDCNRPTSQSSKHVLTAPTEAALLEAMAAYKIRMERLAEPEEAEEARLDGEFCTVAFGDILCVAAAKPCPEDALRATGAWQRNLAAVKARQAEQKTAAMETAKAEAAEQEAAARAAYLELKARFEPDSTPAPGMGAP